MNLLILGCGWVGQEFGLMMSRQGARITVTTTKPEKANQLSQLGFESIVVNFDQDIDTGKTINKKFDAVLNSIPASKKMSESEIGFRFSRVKELLSNIYYKKHIYLSSIGVYPPLDGLYDETFADATSLHPALKMAEDLLSALPRTIVYRLGGLFGKERILAKYFQNRICTTGSQPSNFVHLDDVLELIKLGFEKELKQDLYNVVAPEHPKKEEVILYGAERHGFGLPSGFDNTINNYQKVVSGHRLESELNYKFKFPSPLDF